MHRNERVYSKGAEKITEKFPKNGKSIGFRPIDKAALQLRRFLKSASKITLFTMFYFTFFYSTTVKKGI